MTFDPSLSLGVAWDGKRITGARVDPDRDLASGSVLEGRAVDEAIAAVPRLFSLCKRSQRAAGALACALARDGSVDEALRRRAECEVLAECAIESLWRLLLDWPALLGEAPRVRDFARFRSEALACMEQASVAADADTGAWRTLADALDGFLAGVVLGTPAERWRAQPWASWQASGAWLAHVIEAAGGTPAVAAPLRALPWLEAEALCREIAGCIEADDFARHPEWMGEPAETGSLARRHDHPKVAAFADRPVAARLVAKVVELAEIPTRLRELVDGAHAEWVRGTALAPGRAIAAVDTARGTLLHGVALDGDTVERWRIVPPTQWNFHPAGAFARGIVGIEARSAEQAHHAARALACALDPCVAFEVSVGHA